MAELDETQTLVQPQLQLKEARTLNGLRHGVMVGAALWVLLIAMGFIVAW